MPNLAYGGSVASSSGNSGKPRTSDSESLPLPLSLSSSSSASVIPSSSPLLSCFSSPANGRYSSTRGAGLAAAARAAEEEASDGDDDGCSFA